MPRRARSCWRGRSHGGALPLPKASSPERQVENLEAPSVTLSGDDIDAITALGRPDGRINDQDPATYEEF